MKTEALPMKPAFVYTEQFNLRIEKDLKEDIRFLSDSGVEVSELVRPVFRELVQKARRQIEDSKAS
jgi:TRAP-type C4-dicarboxylate transport system substrate-binding protein